MAIAKIAPARSPGTDWTTRERAGRCGEAALGDERVDPSDAGSRGVAIVATNQKRPNSRRRQLQAERSTDGRQFEPRTYSKRRRPLKPLKKRPFPRRQK